MSHKTEVKLKLNNKNYLMKALDKLGIEYKVGENLVTRSPYRGSNSQVDVLLEGTAQGHVGFRQDTDGNFIATGDFYQTRTKDGRRLTADMLNEEVTALAKEAEICERLMCHDFTVQDGSRVDANGEIKLKLERWTA